MNSSTHPGGTNFVRWRGFSLIELLIALAVVSILVTLLISVAKTALGNAESAQCVSRLRQIGIAFLSYANDHKGFVPSRLQADADNPGSKLIWPDVLRQGGYLGLPWGSSREQQRQSGIFFCPGFPVGKSGDLMCYGVRRWRTPGATDIDDTQNLRALSRPADFWLVTDSVLNLTPPLTQGYFIGTGGSPWAIRFSHANHANTVFADGHVEAKSREYFDRVNVEQGEFGVSAPWSYWP